MATFTINTLLCLQKNLRTRQTQLKELISENSKKTTWMRGGEADKIEEPMYNVKRVDQKIVALNKTLFDIDMKLKEINALTKVEVEMDYDVLMSAIE